MKFENEADKIERKQIVKLFGIKEHSFCPRERRLYRKWSMKQATLKGYGHKVKKRYERIHAKGLTVDHIVPLWGCNEAGTHIVCGLNVPWNMRGETKEDNCKKANLFVDNAESIGIITTNRAKQKSSIKNKCKITVDTQ